MRFILLISFLISGLLTAEGQDINVYDSLSEVVESDGEDMYGVDDSDSTAVSARYFPNSKLNELKDDSALQYTQPPTVAESLWERFKRMVSMLLDSLFNGAIYTDWGRVFSYIAGLAVLILIIMLILKVDAFKVFYSHSSVNVPHGVVDENIHQINFEKEIDAATSHQDYRRAVRLLFLYALKLLTDKHHLYWQQGKTNHDYVSEVKEEALKKWLSDLSYYFDYAWYGNFVVSRQLFEKVNSIFSEQKGRIP